MLRRKDTTPPSVPGVPRPDLHPSYTENERRLSSAVHSSASNLAEDPNNPSLRIRIHRQEVDHFRSALPVVVAVAHQARGDRVTVGLVAGQDAPEVVAGLRVKRSE